MNREPDQKGIQRTGRVMLIMAWVFGIGILTLLFAIAFLSLKRWAWYGYIVMLGLAILFGIIGMAVNGFNVSSLIGIIIDVLLILYMNSKNVKEAFFGVR